MRAGTVNVPGIVGFGVACERARHERPREADRVRALRDHLCQEVLASIPEVQVTASEASRLPHFAHLCFRGLEGEAILTGLDASGVYASAGAACSAGSTEPSHVLAAMGLPLEWARGAVRLTLGRENTSEQVDYVVSVLKEVVTDLRR